MPTKIEKDSLTGRETTGHEWDGIKELNNPLPRWWLYVFYGTIAWSLVWFVLYPSWPWIDGYFEGVLGRQERQVLDSRMAQAQAAQAQYLDAVAAASPAEILEEPQLLTFALAGGEAAFADNCAPCHGLGGAGQAQYPVLADDDWIWGGTLDAIRQTIAYGIRNEHPQSRFSEMPAYGAMNILGREEIVDVANHVLTLSGSEPPDPAAADRGAAIYEAQCSACHGADGGGMTDLGAPALNDQIWLYGGTLPEIVAQISQPRQGAMPAWAPRLDDTMIDMLTVYVHTRGGGE